MNKITVKIEGMMCVMCEAHICDTIRHLYPNSKKVKASRTRREATFLSENIIEEEKLKAAITDTGYTVVSIESEPYKKRGLFG